MVQFSRTKRLASLTNFYSCFIIVYGQITGFFKCSSCRMSDVYNINLGLKYVSEADTRRI